MNQLLGMRNFIRVLLLVTAIVGLAPRAYAAQCTVSRIPNAKDLRIDAFYSGVAIAPSDVWAVGAASNFKGKETLAEHWNGAAWSIVATPNIDSNIYGPNLYGVAAISSST